MNKDAMELTLRELNPDPRSAGPATVDEQLLARVLATSVPEVPVSATRRRRRRAVQAVGGAVAVALGIGAAAAAGVLPDRFVDVFPWMADYPSDSPPKLVAVIDGPWGSEIRYFESVSDDGTICLNHVRFDSDDDAAALLNAKDWTAGGVCGDSGPAPFMADADGGAWYHDVTGTPGEAVTAQIEVSDGTVYPVAIAGGWLMGWFGADQDQTAVLTGYDEQGRPIGQIQLLDRR